MAIQAVITDQSGVASASLFFRGSGANQWSTLIMDKMQGDLYQAVIPGTAVLEPKVEYYLEATDASANQNRGLLPASGAFSFTVQAGGPDTTGPAIAHQPVPGPVAQGTAVSVYALISDPSGVAGAALVYRSAGGSWQEVALTLEGSSWRAEIPAAAVVVPKVEYYLWARDGAAAANVSYFPPGGENEPLSFEVVDTSDRTGPFVEHTPPGGPVKAGESLELTATVTDSSGVSEVILNFRNSLSSGFVQLAMTPQGSNRFSAQVPAQEVIAPWLRYYIEAVDASPNQNSSRLPSAAPGEYFSLAVEEEEVPDTDPPMISDVQANPTPGRPRQPVIISAGVADASGIEAVKLYFRMQGEQSFLTTDMTLSGTVFRGEIPASVVRVGILEYYLEATDSSANRNQARSPADAPGSLHFLQVIEDTQPSDGGCGCSSSPSGAWTLLPLLLLLVRRRSQFLN